MKLIDTHSHLYHENLQPDIDAVLERCKQQQVSVIILPNINEESILPMNLLAEKSDKELVMMPAMGLHPCDVKEDIETQLNFFKTELDKGKYIAIGETGLDYYWDVSLKNQQQISFRTQIEWGIEKKLPIIIHSRNATEDCIKMVKKSNGKAKGVFHCFSGTLHEAEEIIEMGFYLGIGGSVTYKNSTELNQALKQLDLNHIILETDSPYLPPVPHRGKRNESSYVSLVVKHIASLKNISVEEVAETTTQNAKKLFAISI